jgi:ribosomal protein L40E
MDLARGIRTLGFPRWYERRLLESHFHLVTAFFCLVLVLACLEGFSSRAPGAEPLVRMVAMFAGGALGVASLRRYTRLLGEAWRAAERSTCAKCRSYGLLELTSAPAQALAGEAASGPVAVRCRRCGHEWTIA